MLDYDKANNKIALSEVQADKDGKINLHLESSDHETGIFTPADKPEFIFLDYTVSSQHDSAKSQYLKDIQNNRLIIKLLNRGGETATVLK